MSSSGTKSIGGLAPHVGLDSGANQVYHTELYYDNDDGDVEGVAISAYAGVSTSTSTDENGVAQTSSRTGPRTPIALFTDESIEFYKSLYATDIYANRYFVGDDNRSAKVISYLENGGAGVTCYQIQDVVLIEPNWFGETFIGTNNNPFGTVYTNYVSVNTHMTCHGSLLCEGAVQAPAGSIYIQISATSTATLKNYIKGVMNGTY